MANSTTELYTILVQTAGSTANVRALVKQLDTSNRALQETQKATRGLTTETEGLTRAQKQMNLQLQNAGYQFSDFFVQVAGGTDWTRALGQQLPQLLQGLGLVGVALGTAAAAGGAFLPMLFDMSDAAKDADKSIEAYTQTVSDLANSFEATRTPMNEITAQFGIFAETAAQLSDLQLRIDTRQAQLALNAMVESLMKVQVDGESVLDTYNRITAQLAEAKKQVDSGSGFMGLGGTDYLTRQKELQDALDVTAAKIQETTGLSVTEFAGLSDQIKAMEEALKTGDWGAFTDSYRQAMVTLQGANNEFETSTMGMLERLATAAQQMLAHAQAARAPILAAADEAFQSSLSTVELIEQEIDKLRDMILDVKLDPKGFPADTIANLELGVDALTQKLHEAEAAAQQMGEPFKTLNETIDQATRAVDATKTAQESATEQARRFGDALEVARRNASQFDASAIQNLEQALALAVDQAWALSSAVATAQSRLQSLETRRLRQAAEMTARAAGASRELAAAEGEVAVIREDQRKFNEDSKNELYDRYLYNDATEKTIALERELAANAQTQRENDEAARKAASEASKARTKGASDAAKAAKDAKKEFEDFQKSLQDYGSETEKLEREIFELTTNMAKFWDQLTPDEQKLALQGIAELQQKLKETSTQLSEIGEIAESSFNTFFSDLVEGSKTAGEAFSDFLLGMLNDLTKFLFSQQVNAFLGLLAQSPGFGFLNAGASAGVQATQNVQAMGLMGLAATTAEPSAPARGLGQSAYGVTYPNYIPSATAQTSSGFNVQVNNFTSGEVTTEEKTDSQGSKYLDITIRDKVRALVSTGALDKEFQRSFGMRRRPG